MTMFTRRTLVKGGTALAAAGALTGPVLLEWSKAWAQTAPWKPEKGAQLALLRWKYFVQSEEDAFMALLDAFTNATGVKISVTRESYEDIPPKASVAANTNAGPDLFWGLFSLPHLFTDVECCLRQRANLVRGALGAAEVPGAERSRLVDHE